MRGTNRCDPRGAPSREAKINPRFELTNVFVNGELRPGRERPASHIGLASSETAGARRHDGGQRVPADDSRAFRERLDDNPEATQE